MHHRPTRLAVVVLFLLTWVTRANAAPPQQQPARILLLDQPSDGHPPGTHEYQGNARVLAACLKKVPGLTITVAHADGDWPEGPDLLKQADCVVLNLAEGARWISAEPRRLDAFAQFAEQGKGLVALHWAIGCRDAAPVNRFLQLFGGCHGGPDRKYTIQSTDLQPVQAAHPILSGIPAFTVRDEFYYQLKFVQPADGLQPLLNAHLDGKSHTVAWAWQRSEQRHGGRSAGFSGLHFFENWQRPEYRRFMTQCVLWCAHQEIPAAGVDVTIDPQVLELSEPASRK